MHASIRTNADGSVAIELDLDAAAGGICEHSLRSAIS